jgi:hypothetical protein
MRSLIFSLIVLLTLLAASPTLAQTPPASSVIATATESLTLYAWPSTRVPIVAVFEAGSSVTVHYAEDHRVGEWLRVSVNGISGWALSNWLVFEDTYWRNHVPVLPTDQLYNPSFSELDTIPADFSLFVGWCRNNTPILRSQPFSDAEWLLLMDDKEAIQVIGNARVNGTFSRYVLVRHLETGIEGWIHHNCVSYTRTGYEAPIGNLGFINQHLPTYEFTRYERAEDNIEALPATVGVNTYLRPMMLDDSIGNWGILTSAELPVGTPVVLTGRHNQCDYYSYCWFEVQANGQMGWLWAGHLIVEGNYLRLPIVPQ